MNASKYEVGDVLRCTSVTAENLEGLEVGAYYKVAGMMKIDGYEVYAVFSKDNHLHHSIDRFEYVGETILENTKIPYGAELICIDQSGRITDGCHYQFLKMDNGYISVFDDDGEVGNYYPNRFAYCPMVQVAINNPVEMESDPVKDMVNHPEHYTDGGIETIDYIEAKLTEEEFFGYIKATCMKYLSRSGKKGDAIEDLRKAQWYLNRLLDGKPEDKPNRVCVGDGAFVEIEMDLDAKMVSDHYDAIVKYSKELGIDTDNLPEYVSPVPCLDCLDPYEQVVVLDKLITISDWLNDETTMPDCGCYDIEIDFDEVLEADNK